MSKVVVILLLLVTVLLSGCETDANILIKVSPQTVVYAFAETGSECEINAYQSISYTDKVELRPLAKGTKIKLTVNLSSQYEAVLDGSNTKVNFNNLELTPNTYFSVEVENKDEEPTYASSRIPTSPSVFMVSTDTTTINGDEYITCTMRLVDGGRGDHFYQLIARDKWNNVVEDVVYPDIFFEEAKVNMMTETNSYGLFTNNGYVGRLMILHCYIPLKNVPESFALELYHQTYEHYCYLQSIATHEAYILLPVFSMDGLYTNVYNGIGLVSGVNKWRMDFSNK